MVLGPSSYTESQLHHLAANNLKQFTIPPLNLKTGADGSFYLISLKVLGIVLGT